MYRRHPYIAAASLGALLGVGYMLVVCYFILPTP